MMSASPYDVMTEAPGLLAGTLLLALDDAIVTRRDHYAACADCGDGICAEHRDDYALAEDYEAAKTIISTRGTAA
jgi:hypothetical protein